MEGEPQFVKIWILRVSISVCLILWAAFTALWIRSYFILDDISYGSDRHVHNFSSHRGRVFIQWGWSTKNALQGATPRYRQGGWVWDAVPGGATLAIEPMFRDWKLAGFDCFTTPRESDFVIPWWFLFVVTLILPLRWLMSILRWKIPLRTEAESCMMVRSGFRLSEFKLNTPGAGIL